LRELECHFLRRATYASEGEAFIELSGAGRSPYSNIKTTIK